MVKIYMAALAFTGILIFIMEVILIDRKMIEKYRMISKDRYLFDREDVYTILCLYYDLKRYIRSDFSLIDILLFILLNSFYVIYILFSPIIWIKVFILLMEIMIYKIFGINKEIVKPNFSDTKVELSLMNFIKSYLKWIDSFVYICVYSMIKNKRKNIKEIIKNITILYVTGRPLWYSNFCITSIVELKKIINLDIWKRKNKKIWMLILVKRIKILVERKYIEKNIVYLNILRPLKLEVRDIGIYINGLGKLIETVQMSNFLVYKHLVSVVANGIPHLALVNKDKTSAQILTSSKQIWSKSQNKFISANLLHTNNVEKPQYCILSSIDANDVHEFVVTSAWSNLQIGNTQEFIGFITKANLQFWGHYGREFLIQNGIENFKEIVNLTNATEEEFAKIKDPRIEDRFKLLQAHVWSFGEKILQDEAHSLIVELNKETEFLSFEEMWLKLEKTIAKNELVELYDYADREFKYTLLKNSDY